MNKRGRKFVLPCSQDIQTNKQRKEKDFDSSIVMKMKFRIRMTYVKTHTKQKINRKGKKNLRNKGIRSRKK